ncbi:MAG: hypothetical protein FWF49_04850, partial [Oscillospiraceae bacterium]|nr:hypothetical protein [Oscillospiraceae bacterium]
SLIDVTPTLLSLCGILGGEDNGTDAMQGIDLSPALLYQQPLPRDRVFIECTHRELAVRTRTHKYVVKVDWPDNRQSEQTVTDDALRFFDLAADPYELHNIAGTGEQPAVAEDLRQSLLAFQRQPWFVPDSMQSPV